VCVLSVYFEGHRAEPLTGLLLRSPKGRPTRTPPPESPTQSHSFLLFLSFFYRVVETRWLGSHWQFLDVLMVLETVLSGWLDCWLTRVSLETRWVKNRGFYISGRYCKASRARKMVWRGGGGRAEEPVPAPTGGNPPLWAGPGPQG